MSITKFITLAAVFLFTLISGCTGTRTFHDHARAGDTIAVAAGWMHQMQRDNIQITITDANSVVTTYSPGNSAVRASVNLYPDPVSSIVLSDRLNTDLTPGSSTYSFVVNFNSTGDDRDWWETVVFLDLPDPMALGDATIDISTISGPSETASSVVTIVPDQTGIGTGGTANTFPATAGNINFNLQNDQLTSLERINHYVISFNGVTVPHAIEVEIQFDPDAAHGGTGIPYVVNPLGTVKNIAWSPTGTSGTNVKAIITPTKDGEIINMKDLKFYIAGGVTGVTVVDQDTGDSDLDVLAYDINGNQLTDQVTATITSN